MYALLICITGNQRFSPLSLIKRVIKIRHDTNSRIKRMTRIKNKIEETIKAALKDLNIEARDFAVEHPENISFGDYSTNVAMALSKSLGKNPFDLASEIAGDISANLPDFIEKVEALRPGFINFHLSSNFLLESVGNVLEEGEKFGSSDLFHDQKIIIEYTNTNVLKPMHIGHLMGNVIGQSLSNVFEASGAEIKRNTYQGDVGLHIAKAVWGIIKSGGIIDGSLSEKVDYVGKCYALGANAYEDEPAAAEEIKEINKKVFEKNDEKLNEIYAWARQVSLDHFEDLYKYLNTKFDYYFFESEVSNSAVAIVKEYLQKGVFEESDGAVIFRGENYDPKLHTRVFLTQQGLPLYEAKDIAHALRKESVYSADESIIITANEQDGYFKVVLKALEQIDKKVADKTKHLSHGILKLPSGKMSSRTGTVITAETLINQVKAGVMEKIEDRGFDESEKQSIAEIVAVGGIKYSILRQSVGGDIVFDFDKSISFDGDSGPYLQYTAVRAKSVLEKAKSENLTHLTQFGPSGDRRGEEEFSEANLFHVEKLLYRFPEVVERSAKDLSPHHIVTYLTDLAGEYNRFYAHNQIIDTENKELTSYRLALTKAVQITLTNGLHLLGIKVPERM